jgi:hypothetical protein
MPGATIRTQSSCKQAKNRPAKRMTRASVNAMKNIPKNPPMPSADATCWKATKQKYRNIQKECKNMKMMKMFSHTFVEISFKIFD